MKFSPAWFQLNSQQQQDSIQWARDRIRLSRSDPNEFVEFCFTDSAGRPIRQAGVHRELQSFLTENPKALIELPRDHGKSFQICCRVLWELGRNPGLRVRIICATGAIAAERARFLRDAIDNTFRVQMVFPRLASATPWASTSFTIQRPANAIGPSVTAYGIGAGSTGTRADLLVCDDVVDVRALHNAGERGRVADYFGNNLMNLLEPDGRFWGLFTPWHGDDLNARLKKNASFQLFRRAVGADFEPVWPEKWGPERLRMRKEEIGAASFARGYRLVPMADGDTLIRPEWIRFWTEPVRYDRVVLAVDPAVSVRAKSDASALVVIGMASRECLASREHERPLSSDATGFEPLFADAPGSPVFHVLEATARRVTAPDLVALIDDCERRWNPEVILFESNAAFLGIKDLLVRHARYGPRIKGIVQSADKAARVAALSVSVENGCVLLHRTQRELFDEMVSFPFGEHDDLLDAAAMGTAWFLGRREPRIWI